MTAQLPFIKFKEREDTKGIKLSYLKADMPLKEFAQIQMKKGWFSVGYNYLLHSDGSMEEGIHHTQLCDPTIDGYEDHVCVLVMGQCEGKLNPVQQSALEVLAGELKLPIVGD